MSLKCFTNLMHYIFKLTWCYANYLLTILSKIVFQIFRFLFFLLVIVLDSLPLKYHMLNLIHGNNFTFTIYKISKYLLMIWLDFGTI